MEILTKAELKLRKDELIEKIKGGSIFIHPTDTIYRIACDASNEDSIKKVRELKQKEAPFSIIVPSIKWIKDNCVFNNEEELKKLPGPYTFILKSKNVAPNKDTIGVRIPDHWISEFVEELNIPIITTAVNKAGQPFMTDLSNLDKNIEEVADFCIYEGERKAKPCKIINLT